MKKKTLVQNLSTIRKGNHLDLYLFGVIGDWWEENTAEDFVESIRNQDVSTITVYLNTVGGTFLDGLPIFNLLKLHPAEVTVKVMGYALSMGSVIMLAADKGKVEVAENSLIMIHRAQGFSYGDADFMKSAAGILEKHEAAVMSLYTNRLGKNESEVLELLKSETWYTAQEAVDAGLADKIILTSEFEKVDEKLAENSFKFADENFHNMPNDFKSLISNQLNQKNESKLTKFVNAVVGKPAPHIENININHEDEDEMALTQEELAEALDKQKNEMVVLVSETVKNVLADDKEASKAAATEAAAVAELMQLKSTIAKLKQENADLKQVDDPTIIDENCGANEDAGGCL